MPKSKKKVDASRASLRDLFRLQRLKVARMSWRNKLAFIGFMAFLGATLSSASGSTYTRGAEVGATLAIVLFIAFVEQDVLKIFAVISVYALLSAPLGLLYTAMAPGHPVNAPGDMVGGALSLFIAMLFAVMIAIRYSRGKTWITLALTGASIIFPGILFLVLIPSLGLNAARLSMIVTLAFRCGGWSWLTGLFGLITNRESGEAPEFKEQSEDISFLKAWDKRAAVEKDTSNILSKLDKEYTVFHDVKVKGSNNPLGHLVIGPSGATLIASIYSEGPLLDDAVKGITLPKIALDKTVGSLIQQRENLAQMLKCAERDLSIVVVIHGMILPWGRKSLAFFAPDNLITPAGQIPIIDSTQLLAEVAPGMELWSRIKVKQTVSRAKMKLHPAVAPINVTEKESDIPRLSPLDSDGHPTIANDATNLVPSWMVVGIPVNVMTTAGIRTSLRIAGNPVRDSHGFMMVPVCAQADWDIAQKRGTRPPSYECPVSAVILP